MDSFELTKISGAVLAALLLMLAPKTISGLAAGGGTHKAAAAATADTGKVEAGKDAGHDAAVSRGHEAGGHVAGTYAGYTLPAGAAKDAKAEGGAAEAAFDPAAVVKLLAAAKPENGEGIYKKCASCHTNDKAAKSGSGPNFWGLVGRKKGAREDFSGYSDAMKAKGGEWTFADLAAFLHNPKGWMPGTKMAIQVADPVELADLLAYLRTLSDSPVALP